MQASRQSSIKQFVSVVEDHRLASTTDLSAGTPTPAGPLHDHLFRTGRSKQTNVSRLCCLPHNEREPCNRVEERQPAVFHFLRTLRTVHRLTPRCLLVRLTLALKCSQCFKQFNVTVGMVFEGAHARCQMADGG